MKKSASSEKKRKKPVIKHTKVKEAKTSEPDVPVAAHRKKHFSLMLASFFIIFMLGNGFLLARLIFLFGLLPPTRSYFMVGVVGISFGFIIDHIVKHHEEFSANHYLLTWTFLPLMSLAIIYSVLFYAKSFWSHLGIFTDINPLILVVVYVVFFSLPHSIQLLINKKRR